MLTSAYVIRVVDGDTILARMVCPCCRTSHESRIRLARIDAAELHGARAQEAREHRRVLAALIEGRDVAIGVVRAHPDRYGRVLGEVILDGLNISNEMLKVPGIREYKPKRSDLPIVIQ